MLNFDLIKKKLDGRLTDIEYVGESVFKCIRKHGDSPISYYYFDYSENISEAAADLKLYQDKVLVNQYFANPGEIQWSYYLVFLLSSSKYKEMQKNHANVFKIEKDKTFTRKFIISEDNLENFLDVPVLSMPNTGSPVTDLSARWVEKLDNQGLQGIYGKSHRTEVIRNYISGETRVEQTVEDLDFSQEVDLAGRKLVELNLKKYRPYPLKREFKFGAMNLLVGPNGVGKTSLLEAIETIYAGATLRSEGKLEANSDLHFKFENDAEFETYDPKANKKYQQRDLIWYGRSISKGNDLYSSFNKYNFYNSDSAYKLANETKDDEIDSAFSALALGEKANYIDKRLRDFQKDFEDKKSAQEKQLKQLEASLLNENEKLKKFSDLENPSQKLFESFSESLKKVVFVGNVPTSLDEAEGEFSKTIVDVRNDLSMLVSGVSVIPLNQSEVTKKLKTAQQASNNIATLNADLENYRKELLGLDNNKSSHKLALSVLKKLKPYFENQNNLAIVGIVDKQTKLHSRINFLNKIIEMRNDIAVDPFTTFDKKMSLALVVSEHQSRIDLDQKSLKDLQVAYVVERERLSTSQTLFGEIRALATKYVHEHPDLEDCPICTAVYPVGKLEEILKNTISKGSSNLLAQQKVVLDELEEKLKLGVKIMSELKKIQDLMNVSKDVLNFKDDSIQEILSVVSLQVDEKRKLETELRELKDKVSIFTAMGLTETEYNSLISQSSAYLIDRSLTEIEIQITAHSDFLVKVESRETVLLNEITEINQKKILEVTSIFSQKELNVKTFEDDLYKRIGELRHLSDLIEKLLKKISFNPDEDLVETKRTVDGIATLLMSIIKARNEEKTSEIEIEAAKKSINELTVKIANEEILLEKVKGAADLITDILLNDGKEKALTDFIEKNRGRIDNIFFRIHSPQEFEGLIPGTTQLRRKGETSATPLNEVSTGQRAALALSVFFALNLSLKKAPPVILIDDPVAHVDDLNTLSFLDFLRELVIKSGRQIFFATASLRLANLIQKKFLFLGDDFQRHDFSRE